MHALPFVHRHVHRHVHRVCVSKVVPCGCSDRLLLCLSPARGQQACVIYTPRASNALRTARARCCSDRAPTTRPTYTRCWGSCAHAASRGARCFCCCCSTNCAAFAARAPPTRGQRPPCSGRAAACRCAWAGGHSSSMGHGRRRKSPRGRDWSDCGREHRARCPLPSIDGAWLEPLAGRR